MQYDTEVIEMIEEYRTLTPEERAEAMRRFLAALAEMYSQQA